ncbi:MAG TPA: hypothetical protein PL182_10175 [Pseudobdellovibrionaceae bacterium]|nr:hypothetical protein [Pseudobdellovibrionaceae bacterium]
MKKIFMLGLLTACLGCGVKGRPLPPLEPIRPGDGTLRSEKEKKKETTSPLAKPIQR